MTKISPCWQSNLQWLLAFWLAISGTCASEMSWNRVRADDRANGDQFELEITEESEAALQRGLQWLARNQGPEGNWESRDLGLVGMGVLAFLAAGHAPGRGKYGANVERAIDYMLANAKPNGLLNISDQRRDMYNHGLATFVLGQAYGMTGDKRISSKLDLALKVIANTQCEDGGWDYIARRQSRGHDLSLAVMQAKALRSATDSGLEVPPEVIKLAISSVRKHHRGSREGRGQFTYHQGGGKASIAMAAAGVVCLQEYAQYDDWRIPKNMAVIRQAILNGKKGTGNGYMPFDAYTLYYVGQALYQVGGQDWQDCYPLLRDRLVASQVRNADSLELHGCWYDRGLAGGGHVGQKPGQLYGTSVACFILAVPNRYLPILQEGKIGSSER